MPSKINVLSFIAIAVVLAGCATAGKKQDGVTETTTTRKSGVTTHAYITDKERIDQEMSGNSGYLMGAPKPVDRSNVSKTRKIFVVEMTKEVPEGDITTRTETVPVESAPAPESRWTQPEKAQRESIVLPTFEDEGVQEDVSGSAQVASGASTEYTVQKNDTLQKISKKFYGSYSKWMRIYDANKEVIGDPNSIREGMVLQIPQD